ncbi:hypothetical protein [Thalassoglobus polymorphus]|uniref:Uncharacterized protein n=1 Tax=Thalassoglobus polymorphus TaxID=2527994 RepID=A0A517QR34_9PLAN|nr:hypothetical protein [Thalassoglobus polymorphus]QDT34092.1 hypothetical protein Mal48_33520 [Thalassoglobus polymorphus]
MAEFLQLVGAIVLAIIFALVVLVAGGYFWLRWKLSSLSDSLSEKFSDAIAGIAGGLHAGGVPPLRIQLLRVEGHEWSNAQQIEEWTSNLQEQGFQVIGDFDVIPAMMELRALLHEETDTYAVFYEHPMVGNWFDIVSLTDDGSASFTISTDQKNQMDRRDDHPLTRITPLTTPAKAYQKFLKERPQRTWSRASKGDFVPRFEKAYAEEMDWRVNRGGPTEEEIRRIAQQDGTDVTPQMVSSIQEAWANQAAYLYDEEMEKNYLESCGLSAVQWEAICDRLVFVHELTNASQILEHLYNFDIVEFSPVMANSDYDEQLASIKEICAHQQGDAAFQRVLEKWQITGQFEKHGQIDTPIPATVYLGPAQE